MDMNTKFYYEMTVYFPAQNLAMMNLLTDKILMLYSIYNVPHPSHTHLSLYSNRQWNSVSAMPTGVLVSESLQ